MLKPIMEKILVKQIHRRTTDSGLFIPDSAKQEKRGIIVALGDGDIVDGKLVPFTVKEGDEVVWMPYAGQPVIINNEEFIIIRQSDIVGIEVKDEPLPDISSKIPITLYKGN